MDDQTLETISASMKLLNLDSDGQTLDTPKIDSEQVETSRELVDETSVSSESADICSDQEQTLPIIRKIDDLSNKVMKLRKEHTVLCNEVKGITVDSLPGSDVFNALQGLSEEHENLKKKYHQECQVLKNKYLHECSERKRLYNEVIELKGNIRVFCRCRPLNQDEIAKGSTSVVDFESYQENELQILASDSSRKQFKFDHVFSPEDNQEAVFVQTLPVVTSVLDGYNVCIFAYGQTGTGKTFTMEGNTENRGVNYRTLEELFRISEERSTIMAYELSVSMLEVYNEKIRDLLVENTDQQPPKKLEIKQSAEGTQEVPGLIEAHVYNTNEVWELLKSGSRARSVGATNANELSSRSHCLLRVTVIGKNLINGQRTRSHLWLVDLAGSERVGKIEVEGERLKESQFINKSLSALGDVISALAAKTAHVPYRNSKLTHMLQSSLGGDCKTLMFVQISPSSTDLGETLCSLNFASRVRGIEHGPVRKQADTTDLFKYKQLAEKAKHDEKELKKLQDNLQSFQLRLAAREHICRGLQEKVRDLESQLAEERKARQKQENRALAAVSAHPSASSTVKQQGGLSTISERRPPLGPSKLRLPLRGITNFLPQPSPRGTPKQRASMLPVFSSDDKENTSRTSTMKARRGSFAVRPPPSTNQVMTRQPKRRASIATLRPEASSSNITSMAPLDSSASILSRNKHMSGRKSFVWDPQRMWRTSKVQSPLPPQCKGQSSSRGGQSSSRGLITTTAESTPVAVLRSSKFMGSPPSQVGSWKPKHPTVIALQRKQLVWSPLKYKGMKTNRRSLLPS